MSVMSIKALEILEQSQMPPAHARAIAKAIESDFTHRLDALATKSELQAGIGILRSELHSEVSNLRASIAEVKGELVRWVFLAIMGQTALLSGIMYFLLQMKGP